MTRQEFSNERDLRFSQWVREKLPDSYKGFRAYDLDWIFWEKGDYGRVSKVMLVEVKTRDSQLKPDQKKIYEFLDSCIKYSTETYYDYWGFHIIRFENTFFDDGKVYFDNIESNEEEIRKTLSFQMRPPK